MTILMLCLLGILLISRKGYCFDGKKWHVSTGNLSVSFIQASPIGAYPKDGYQIEPPPPHAELVELKHNGAIAYEDYIAWGAVERQPGKWDWRQHDAVCDALKKAGLQYVVYNWVHFPPVWLRESPNWTPMRCLEHHTNTNYLSIFDPRTLEYYDHFYKELAAHFGSRIDGVYACILGPYGEGNYPLMVPEFINMGHCHEGYWCADAYAVSAFRDAMRSTYQTIGALNAAWGSSYRNFASVAFPKIISEGVKPSPKVFSTAEARREWLDFITWYHQALIDFTYKSLQITLRYFPKEKVRTKPGGNAGGVNPIAWGTYCPGYAKMAQGMGITMQPADCRGAVFGDKWTASAYNHYKINMSTEPAGGMDNITFVRRMFSDATGGASQLFTYEYMQHAPLIQRYVHLYTGKPGDTHIAVLCPTTDYRLGADFTPIINASEVLRDYTDFDVLDELLIIDGALTSKYKTAVILMGEYVEQTVLDKLEHWVKSGGQLVICAPTSMHNVEGVTWSLLNMQKLGSGRITVIPAEADYHQWIAKLIPAVDEELLNDGVKDGVWVAVRCKQTLLFNTTNQPVKCKPASVKQEVTIPPLTIVEVN